MYRVTLRAVAGRCQGRTGVAGLVALLAVAATPVVADNLPTVDEINSAMDAYILCGKNHVKLAVVPSLEAAQAACAKQLDTYATLMHKLALGKQLAEGRKPDAAETYAKLKERWARQEAVKYFATQYEFWTGKR